MKRYHRLPALYSCPPVITRMRMGSGGLDPEMTKTDEKIRTKEEIVVFIL